MRKMKNYSTNILGVSEYRWPGADRIKLNNKKMIIYSRTPAAGREKAVLILNDTVQRAILTKNQSSVNM